MPCFIVKRQILTSCSDAAPSSADGAASSGAVVGSPSPSTAGVGVGSGSANVGVTTATGGVSTAGAAVANGFGTSPVRSMPRFFASFLMKTLTVVCKPFAGDTRSDENGECSQTGHESPLSASLPRICQISSNEYGSSQTYTLRKLCYRSSPASLHRWRACCMSRIGASQVLTPPRAICVPCQSHISHTLMP